MGFNQSQVPGGVYSGRTVTPRRVLVNNQNQPPLSVGVLLDKTHSYDGGNTSYEKAIRGGCFLAYNSTTKTWAPVKRTKANALGSSTTALVVDNATHFRVGDSILVGNNAANVATAIDFTTHTITLTSATTWADNEPVVVDAWKTARGVLLSDEVSLYHPQTPGTYVDGSGNMAIRALIDQDKLLGDVASILEDPDSVQNLTGLTFDDYQLGIDTLPVPYGMFGLRKIQYVGGDLTVTAAMNGTLFLATAAVNFTLPTKAAGLHFGFMQLTDNNLVITSAGSADDLVTDGDLGADTITYSTSSHKIGATVLVMVAPNLLKWLTWSPQLNAQTIA